MPIQKVRDASSQVVFRHLAKEKAVLTKTLLIAPTNEQTSPKLRMSSSSTSQGGKGRGSDRSAQRKMAHACGSSLPLGNSDTGRSGRNNVLGLKVCQNPAMHSAN